MSLPAPGARPRLRVAFAGTPPFARSALEALHAAGFEVALVLTQPDRPAGRGMKLAPSPVKAFALEHGLALAQPRSLRLDGKHPDDARAAQAALQAVFQSGSVDVMVVAAYGLILPQWVLDLPPRGCLNIHASLLPRWRGAAPIHRAIEAGDATTGITLMQMDAGLDTGEMLLVEPVAITPEDTAATLQDRLAALGGRLVALALGLAERGELRRTAQPADGATYAHKIDKSEAAVDWSTSAAAIERRLRALDPFPGATGRLGAETVKLWRGSVVPGEGRPGEILQVSDKGIVIACGAQALRITELQRPGGRRVSAAQFLIGASIAPGMSFRRTD
jgi:methionyl-tRNA formyltransferase